MKARLLMVLPVEMHQTLKKLAKREKTSMSNLLRKAVQAMINETA